MQAADHGLGKYGTKPRDWLDGASLGSDRCIRASYIDTTRQRGRERPEAQYFGGRVEEHLLVPLDEARLGCIGFNEWLRRSQAAA